MIRPKTGHRTRFSRQSGCQLWRCGVVTLPARFQKWSRTLSTPFTHQPARRLIQERTCPIGTSPQSPSPASRRDVSCRGFLSGGNPLIVPTRGNEIQYSASIAVDRDFLSPDGTAPNSAGACVTFANLL